MSVQNFNDAIPFNASENNWTNEIFYHTKKILFEINSEISYSYQTQIISHDDFLSKSYCCIFLSRTYCCIFLFMIHLINKSSLLIAVCQNSHFPEQSWSFFHIKIICEKSPIESSHQILNINLSQNPLNLFLNTLIIMTILKTNNRIDLFDRVTLFNRIPRGKGWTSLGLMYNLHFRNDVNALITSFTYKLVGNLLVSSVISWSHCMILAWYRWNSLKISFICATFFTKSMITFCNSSIVNWEMCSSSSFCLMFPTTAFFSLS